MDNKPLVTVGAVNYNNARFLLETLESIKAQAYPNIELILVDDCSTDNSLEIIEEWLKSYDKPYKFFKHPANLGALAGVDDVFNNAKGRYLSCIGTDDPMVPNKIADLVEMFLSSEPGEVAMVYGDTTMIDEDGSIIHPSMYEYYRGKNFKAPSGNIFREVLKEFYFFWQASLIDLELFKNCNFQFDRNVISEDWDLQLALSRKFQVLGTNTVQAKYRRVGTGVTLTNWTSEKIIKVRKSQFYMIRKYYNHPLNNDADNKAVVNKLKELYWEIYQHKNSTYGDKINYYWQIYKCSHSLKDLLFVGLLVLGIENIRKPFLILKNN